jgi:hypothetical protein
MSVFFQWESQVARCDPKLAQPPMNDPSAHVAAPCVKTAILWDGSHHGVSGLTTNVTDDAAGAYGVWYSLSLCDPLAFYAADLKIGKMTSVA